MSEYYIIGPNRTVAAANDATYVCNVEHNGTTYVYWRDSTGDGASIKMSSSTDGVTWTTPVVSWSTASGFDVRPAGVVWSGTQFVMAVALVQLVNNTVTTQLLGSAAGATYTLLGTVAWSDFWAHPSDLHWDGSKFYLVATTKTGLTSPERITVKTSDMAATVWTSLGYPSNLTSVGLVHPKLALGNGVIHLVAREGAFALNGEDDRIVHVPYVAGSWLSTEVVVEGTGNPDIAVLAAGYAVIYQDQSIQGGQGVWSWMYYDGADFFKRGTFSQGFEYGMGGSVMPTVDGFAAAYATRIAEGSVAGTVYYRAFVDTVDEPATGFVPRQRDVTTPPSDELDNFSLEISYGSYWVSLSDSIRFYVSPEDFGDKAQTNRRITASSPFYEGTYLIHAVRDNVTENLTVGVLGVSQNQVTENLLLLEEMISQPSFRIRLTMGDHVETWSCQTADYVTQRGHIMMHNTRAMMKMQVPRLPEVTYEVT